MAKAKAKVKAAAPKAAVENKAAAVSKAAAPKRKKVVFSVDLGPGKNVSVAGNFNDWDPTATPMNDKNGDGVYTRTVMLEPGTYEYKFVIDGIWCVDTANQHFVPNDLGTLNSVLEVK